MKLVECSNGYLIYEYNNGTAMIVDVLTGQDVKFFNSYMSAYVDSLPF